MHVEVQADVGDHIANIITGMLRLCALTRTDVQCDFNGTVLEVRTTDLDASYPRQIVFSRWECRKNVGIYAREPEREETDGVAQR